MKFVHLKKVGPVVCKVIAVIGLPSHKAQRVPNLVPAPSASDDDLLRLFYYDGEWHKPDEIQCSEGCVISWTEDQPDLENGDTVIIAVSSTKSLVKIPRDLFAARVNGPLGQAYKIGGHPHLLSAVRDFGFFVDASCRLSTAAGTTLNGAMTLGSGISGLDNGALDFSDPTAASILRSIDSSWQVSIFSEKAAACAS